MTTPRKTALITGASGGIGKALAKRFAENRYDLVLVARNADALSKVGAELTSQFAINVETIALDLSEAAAPQILFERVEQKNIFVNVLVNNAGYGIRGDVATNKLEDSLGQVQLNVTALTALTRLFLKPMIERRDGKILNIGSTAGFQPGPHMAVYYATKAYVMSFSEALAAEVKVKGITVTCLCPGPTDTGFQARAHVGSSRLFKLGRPMDAETVADCGYRGLMAGRVVVIAGFRNWLLAQSVRFSPRKVVTWISGRLLE